MEYLKLPKNKIFKKSNYIKYTPEARETTSGLQKLVHVFQIICRNQVECVQQKCTNTFRFFTESLIKDELNENNK